MKWNRDLSNPRVIVLKGLLMLLIALMAGVLLFMQNPGWLTGLLLGCLVFGSCRFYYFLFYVIQNYVDPEFKYAGVLDALRYVLSRKKLRK